MIPVLDGDPAPGDNVDITVESEGSSTALNDELGSKKYDPALELIIGPKRLDDISGWLSVPDIPILELRKEYVVKGISKEDGAKTRKKGRGDGSYFPTLPAFASKKRYYRLPFEANMLRLDKLDKYTKKFKKEFDFYKLYKHIGSNVFVHRERVKAKDPSALRCYCEPSQQCGTSCANRGMLVECLAEVCPCGDQCRNQRFQRKVWKDIEPVLTDGRGVGLNTNESISKGEFVIEYVGEVINKEELVLRREKYAEKFNTYVLNMGNNQEFVDATFKGNVSRFMNHSCDPNCETQKWLVDGEIRVGIFARRDIDADEELTFDYLLEVQAGESRSCLCGSENCRGTLGKAARAANGSTNKAGITRSAREMGKNADAIARRYLEYVALLQRDQLEKGEKRFLVAEGRKLGPVEESRLVEYPPFLHRSLRRTDKRILEGAKVLRKVAYPVKLRKSLMLYLPNI